MIKVHTLTAVKVFVFKIIHSFIFQYEANKSYCEDLTEGKFSFPIIHAIRSSPDNNQVLSILFS